MIVCESNEKRVEKRLYLHRHLMHPGNFKELIEKKMENTSSMNMSAQKEKTEDEREKMPLLRFLLTGNSRMSVQNTKI